MIQFKKAFINLFKAPQTVEYPYKPLPKNENYRGLIEYGEEFCIYCLKCEKVCPPKAILFTHTDNPTSNPKNKKSKKYEYNQWLCIYCGECIRACPKPNEALWQSDKKPTIGFEKSLINENWLKIVELKR